MASNVMAIDLETKNLSSEIGGWENTHMFLVSTAATWDGNVAKAYVEDDVISKVQANEYEILPISQLKYDLDDHFEKGGYLLGHNIASFDLPILKNSMDIYCIGKYLSQKKYIDTSRLISKDYGERFTLENLVSNTLGEHKLLESYMAPALWKAGEFDEVVKYCVDDCKLVYELWQHGKESNLKGFSIDKEEIVEMKMEW
jgi:hypothetical protein